MPKNWPIFDQGLSCYLKLESLSLPKSHQVPKSLKSTAKLIPWLPRQYNWCMDTGYNSMRYNVSFSEYKFKLGVINERREREKNELTSSRIWTGNFRTAIQSSTSRSNCAFRRDGLEEDEGGVGQRGAVPHLVGRLSHQVKSSTGSQGNPGPAASAFQWGPEEVHP